MTVAKRTLAIDGKPLVAGEYSLNEEIISVIPVPTHDITLNWSDSSSKDPTNYDASLDILKLMSKDGFGFEIEVVQIIRIDPMDAPKMISRVISGNVTELDILATEDDDQSQHIARRYSSIRYLVRRMLAPMVSSYSRSAPSFEGSQVLRRDAQQVSKFSLNRR